MQDPVSPRWHEVFFGEKLDRIGNHRVDQPQARKAQDGCTVGANAVLDQGASLSLDPTHNTGEVQHHDEDEQDLRHDNADFNDHGCLDSLVGKIPCSPIAE